ncbi:hypothetical protein JTE90_001954 [Oedothorax gibbosus]|uniref:SH3 domain-binding glutamic acid-rich-like protein n=1 Tax=Oedothorax gibbosus TaxID=931172 RepID=A0AAV6VV09_9ARAC|nr:hypothetical protein JTE90_001954 [Oedothorax gibbosus]
MVIKVYISGICGSHEVRKQQQRVLFILQSLPIDLQIVDITEPGREEDLTFMQEVAKEHNKKTQLPPQIFNGEDYCGDYSDFEVANDDDRIMGFLKLESEAPVTQNHQTNGVSETVAENNSENHVDEIDNTEKDNVEEAKDLGDVEERNQKDDEESNAEETAEVEENVKAASEEASEKEESE